ncbi:MAG: phosphatase family protein, partial [Solirubrobacterales bacterium]|nr:phosphatase family protein [Solirubrobacterales bacterium]
LATFFGELGTTLVAMLTVAIAAAIVAHNVGARAAVLVAASSLAVVASDALQALGNPTPLHRELFGVNAANGLPSSHAAYAASVFGVFAVLGRRHGRPEVVAVSALLIVLMGPARMLSSAHVPSELLAGYGVGLTWLALVLLADQRLSAH